MKIRTERNQSLLSYELEIIVSDKTTTKTLTEVSGNVKGRKLPKRRTQASENLFVTFIPRFHQFWILDFLRDCTGTHVKLKL